ncbi:MAG TPA: amidohydrolase family protein [Gemmatimonadaceae bacterium]|nr:amidohydrolase family protein [Gemmatimonadaceae bacterium]
MSLRHLAILVTFATACMRPSQSPFPAVSGMGPAYELKNGYWFDGKAFRPMTKYMVYHTLTDRRPVPVDSIIDLNGGYVVPPFGEAHNHNAVPSDTAISNKYLRGGIFYVKNPNNFTRDRDRSVGVFNTPTSIDVTFSNGSLTGPGGHPVDLAMRNIGRGVWKPEDGEGSFYYSVASKADVDRAWPRIVASKPDFIKTYLLFSEEYAQRLRDTSTFGWRGLDPKLLPYIVKKAHDAKLRVATHVETATDFRNAVAAGVDEINHLPGFRPEKDEMSGYANLDRYRLNGRDASDAARHHVTVVTTTSEVIEIVNDARSKGGATAQLATNVRDMLTNNLRVLRDAGVRIAIGSDRYRMTSAPEIPALRSLGIFSDAELIRMWSMDTPREIFPDRKIGSLDAGWEASFLVLDGNPLTDFSALGRIKMRMKQGVILEIQ